MTLRPLPPAALSALGSSEEADRAVFTRQWDRLAELCNRDDLPAWAVPWLERTVPREGARALAGVLTSPSLSSVGLARLWDLTPPQQRPAVLGWLLTRADALRLCPSGTAAPAVLESSPPLAGPSAGPSCWVLTQIAQLDAEGVRTAVQRLIRGSTPPDRRALLLNAGRRIQTLWPVLRTAIGETGDPVSGRWLLDQPDAEASDVTRLLEQASDPAWRADLLLDVRLDPELRQELTRAVELQASGPSVAWESAQCYGPVRRRPVAVGQTRLLGSRWTWSTAMPTLALARLLVRRPDLSDAEEAVLCTLDAAVARQGPGPGGGVSRAAEVLDLRLRVLSAVAALPPDAPPEARQATARAVRDEVGVGWIWSPAGLPVVRESRAQHAFLTRRATTLTTAPDRAAPEAAAAARALAATAVLLVRYVEVYLFRAIPRGIPRGHPAVVPLPPETVALYNAALRALPPPALGRALDTVRPLLPVPGLVFETATLTAWLTCPDRAVRVRATAELDRLRRAGDVASLPPLGRPSPPRDPARP